jgi:hypothetical protein
MNYLTTFVLFVSLSLSNGFSSPTDIVAEKVIENVNKDIVSPIEDPNLNVNDPTIVFSDPINSATKLLYDLDVHVQNFVPSEAAVPNDEVGLPTTQDEPVTPQVHIYIGSNSELEIALSKQGDSVSALVVQLDTLQKRIQDTVTELTARRRYILSAMLRPMLNSVRRIRSNVMRIQTQLTSIQSAASAPGTRPNSGLPNPADQTAIDNIRKRVEDIQKRIGDIIGRIGSTLSLPGSNASGQTSQRPPSG